MNTTLREYIPKAMTTKTRVDPDLWFYGLPGETFELLRALDGDGNIHLESGDVLWYCAAIATDLGVVETFLDSFDKNVDPPENIRMALYKSVGLVTEHVKKSKRSYEAVNALFVARELGKIARVLYWISVDRSVVWASVMNANLEKLAGRKAAGTVAVMAREEVST